jgi:hypothetical protein
MTGSMLIKPPASAVARYEPDRHRVKVAAIDYGIKEAKRIKDWPALEEAVDAKIEEQINFVAWWKGNVSIGHGGDRKSENQEPRSRFLKLADAERLTGMPQQRVSDLAKRLAQPKKYREYLLGSGYFAAFLATVHNLRGITGTGKNELYTPAKYVEPARAVLGEIDLDPASCAVANETVRAAKFFDVEDNGLTHEWRGRVWLNAPFSQPLISQFTEKMIKEFRDGRVTEAIMLVHNYTDTKWFHNAAAVCAAICFTLGRNAGPSFFLLRQEHREIRRSIQWCRPRRDPSERAMNLVGLPDRRAAETFDDYAAPDDMRRCVYLLRLQSPNGDDARRLRWALKKLLRPLGLKCLSIKIEAPNDRRPRRSYRSMHAGWYGLCRVPLRPEQEAGHSKG